MLSKPEKVFGIMRVWASEKLWKCESSCHVSLHFLKIIFELINAIYFFLSRSLPRFLYANFMQYFMFLQMFHGWNIIHSIMLPCSDARPLATSNLLSVAAVWKHVRSPPEQVIPMLMYFILAQLQSAWVTETI